MSDGAPSDALDAQISPGDSVLVLTPGHDAADDACLELLTATPPAATNVLFVTFGDAPEERLATWDAHVDSRPASMAIVDVATPTRSAAATAGQPADSDGVSIMTVTGPEQLTALARTVNETLASWDESPHRTAICFHSLTPLLETTDLETVFRFLHLLTARFRRADAVAHFHLDPTVHDDHTVYTLRQLFDAVVEYDAGTSTLNVDTRAPRQ